jgi:nucleotide-binding universal stress UspA family protein
MDQAEPQPLPGQPERRRWGQRAWLRLGRPDASPARPGDAQPGGPGPGTGQPGDSQPSGGQPGEDRPRAGLTPASQPADCPELWPDITQDSDHPVVVGYDGSESSRHALAYAAGMARRLGRSLLVAYVTMPGVFCEPLTGQVIAPSRDSHETQRWLLTELDEICDRTGLDVSILTRQGSPARELAAVADEFTADALVIGAPGHVWHHVAGSVPGWLARHAHCPVIVVP